MKPRITRTACGERSRGVLSRALALPVSTRLDAEGKVYRTRYYYYDDAIIAVGHRVDSFEAPPIPHSASGPRARCASTSAKNHLSQEHLGWTNAVREGLHVADFGGGEALIAEAVLHQHQVASFDHVAIDSSVHACDTRSVPLDDDSVDVAISAASPGTAPGGRRRS